MDGRDGRHRLARNEMTSEALTSEREEIEALLPWFVRGTLAAGDRARVDSYLARHPDMRLQLDLVREEMDESVAANEAVAAAPARRRAGHSWVRQERLARRTIEATSRRRSP